MTHRTYDTGDRRKLAISVLDEDDQPADPAVLFFRIKEPDGVITSYQYGTDSELIRTGVGVFHVYWDCAKAGLHQWRFEASGNINVAEESTFAVRPANVVVLDP